jgi:RHS repeat-associated protein
LTAAGRRTTKTLANGTSEHYSYDVASQLLAITYKKGSTTLDTISYTLNPRGHRTSRTQGTLTENYTYDPLGQLTAVASPTNTQTFAYDPLGNRTTVTATVPSPGTGAYTTNPLNQYTARDADTLSYDPNGNLAKITSPHPPHTATFTHNAKNRLIAATRGTATLHQHHDPRNRLIRRQIGSDTRYLLYDGWNLIAEYAPNGALLAEYLHGPRIDEILCAISGSAATYHHHDGLGSVIILTNAAGSVVERYRYDVFGHVTILDATHAPRPATAHNNRFLFTGREWLAEAGLYDYRNRSYSTTLGRFLQTDPIGFDAGDVNLYRYVSNNPINYIDPNGDTPLITGAIGVGIGAAIGAGVAVWNGGSWSDIGYGALRGGVAGGVTGLTLGFGGAAISGLVGGGIGGGALAGAVGGAAGDIAAQGLDFAAGKRECFDYGELGISAGIGAAFGGAALRPYTAPNQAVTTWAPAGVAPNLNPGRWVMTGGPSAGNYLRTVGPALRGYPYGNSATGTLPGSSLSYPGGATGNMAGLMGQRIVNP